MARRGWEDCRTCLGRGACTDCVNGEVPTDDLIEVAYRAPEKKCPGGDVTDFLTAALIEARRYEAGGDS